MPIIEQFARMYLTFLSVDFVSFCQGDFVKESGTGGSADPGLPDDEFEPTAEMMVNDFDDERTLDEEEALEEAGEQQNELCDLEKVRRDGWRMLCVLQRTGICV
jgi:hypothetical protein